jgi:SAM-dependent methyltransferase
MTRWDQQTAGRFAERYRIAPAEVTRRVELEVIGGDWGANGYTTVAQAGLLARELNLRPGTLLLDLGAGRGWPGLYLAASTGCRVALADVPVEALRLAAGRARAENLAGRAAPVAASARSLPFAPASFDAIVHTDVLC